MLGYGKSLKLLPVRSPFTQPSRNLIGIFEIEDIADLDRIRDDLELIGRHVGQVDGVVRVVALHEFGVVYRGEVFPRHSGLQAKSGEVQGAARVASEAVLPLQKTALQKSGENFCTPWNYFGIVVQQLLVGMIEGLGDVFAK